MAAAWAAPTRDVLPLGRRGPLALGRLITGHGSSSAIAAWAILTIWAVVLVRQRAPDGER